MESNFSHPITDGAEDTLLLRLYFATSCGKGECVQTLLRDSGFVRELCGRPQHHVRRTADLKSSPWPSASSSTSNPYGNIRNNVHTNSNSNANSNANANSNSNSNANANSNSNSNSNTNAYPYPHPPRTRAHTAYPLTAHPHPNIRRPSAPHSASCDFCALMRRPLSDPSAAFCAQLLLHPTAKAPYMKLRREEDSFHTWTQLHWSVALGLYDYAYALLKSSASDIHSTDNKQRTPAHLCVLFGQVAFLGMLRSFGANMDARDSRQRTVLHYATILGDAQACWLLLRSDSEKEYSDDRVEYTKSDGPQRTDGVIRPNSSLRSIVDPNAADDMGRTPLHYLFINAAGEFKKVYADDEFAGCGGQIKYYCISFMLQKGASIVRRDDSRLTPVDYAARLGLMGAVHLMIQKVILHSNQVLTTDQAGLRKDKQPEQQPKQSLPMSLDENSALPESVREDWAKNLGCGCHDPAEYWAQHVNPCNLRRGPSSSTLSADATREATDPELNPYHVAARCGHARCIYLLATSSYPGFSSPDTHQRTPLHYAAMGDHIDVVNLLLQLGASANTQDTDGNYPYQLAQTKECVDVLQRARASKRRKKSKPSQLNILSRESSVSVVESPDKTDDSSPFSRTSCQSSARHSPAESQVESIEELLDLTLASLDPTPSTTPAPVTPQSASQPQSTSQSTFYPQYPPPQRTAAPPSFTMARNTIGRPNPVVFTSTTPTRPVPQLPTPQQPPSSSQTAMPLDTAPRLPPVPPAKIRNPFAILPPISLHANTRS